MCISTSLISTKSISVLGLHLGVLVLEILQEIEWQIGDFREDGNARVTEDSNQYGRSFTRSL